MSSTPDRVRTLISESGLTQHDFAQQVGLDDSKLSKALGGSRRFSSLDLARIADLCKVTVDWLITGDEPPLALAARTTGGSAGTAIREARRLSTMRSDLADLGFGQPWQPVDVDLGTGSWTEQGSRLAAAALARMEQLDGSAQQGDLAGLVEAVFGADVAVLDLGNGFDGLATSSDEVKLIVLATSPVPARQRFTLAHELGHLLAGDDQGVHLDEDIFDKAQAKNPSEMRANAFAASFLMPEQTLRAAVGTTGLTEQGFAVARLRSESDTVRPRLPIEGSAAGRRGNLRPVSRAERTPGGVACRPRLRLREVGRRGKPAAAPGPAGSGRLHRVRRGCDDASALRQPARRRRRGDQAGTRRRDRDSRCLVSTFLFPDNTVLCNFAAVERLDLLETVLNGRGRWTAAVAFEAGRSARFLPALARIAIEGWLDEPVEITAERDVQRVNRVRRAVFGGTDDEPLKHLGEAETCFVIKEWTEFADSWWISDDREAVRYARFQGITTYETVDLMSMAVGNGDITEQRAFDVMILMREAGRSLRLPRSAPDLRR